MDRRKEGNGRVWIEGRKRMEECGWKEGREWKSVDRRKEENGRVKIEGRKRLEG